LIYLGVNLTPIIEKKVVTLEKLRGKSFAVDAFVVLHQFLALVRTRDGLPLMNNSGEVTSHLVGLTLRTSNLISNYDMKFIFVFDGKPPELKNTELLKRKETKKRAENEYEKAILAKDYDAAFSKAVMTGHLTKQNIDDSKKLLSLMGVNWIQAPSEGEAQAAYMAKQNIVWACNSQDYDSLLYGTPRLVRYITIQGEEWLPSKNKARKLFPEIINLEDFLKKLEITREQLIDVGILIGTDYNNGIKGIGPKNAIKLIKTYGQLEKIPNEIRDNLPQNIDIIRNIYLKPEINENYYLNKGEFNEDELISFLCNKHNFSKKTVDIIINRIKKGKGKTDLNQWLV
jgi:flap endonuclease-1